MKKLNTFAKSCGVKGHVAAAVRHFPILHHSADYIHISFRIIEPILVTLKIWIGGMYSLANYTAACEETL